MKVFIAFALIATLGALYMFNQSGATLQDGSGYESAFLSFVSEYGRTYADQDEYNMRFSIFKKNVDFINSENKKGYTHTLAVNHFADWTDAEFNKVLGMQNAERSVRTEEQTFEALSADGIPTFDWSTMGNGKAVHPVED
jgi:hypothetical protein